MVAKDDEKHVVELGNLKNLKNLKNQGDIENKIHIHFFHEVLAPPFSKVDINKIDIDLNIIIVCKSIICHLEKSKTQSYSALISGRK